MRVGFMGITQRMRMRDIFREVFFYQLNIWQSPEKERANYVEKSPREENLKKLKNLENPKYL